MSGPLSGYRVVDFTNVIAGPYATMILADQGADVIKIEAPQRPDFTRQAGNGQKGMRASFLNNNRNKRSIVIDVKSDAGRDALKKLVATADVFIQNFRPGVVERLGISEPELRAITPDIIYVSMSGWGERGPFAHKPVYDPIIQALSGLATVQAGSDQERPRLIRTILPDKLTGMTAAQAVVAALAGRAKSGEGQHVKVSMLDSIIAFLWSSDMGSQTFVGNETSVQRAATFIDLIYETQTDYITVSTMTNDQWSGFCKVANCEHLLEDERFNTPAKRDANADERLNLIQEALLERPAEEWLKTLDDAGVPSAPVLTRQQMIDHPQVQASEIVIEHDHPHAGRLRQARPAARFEGTPTSIRHGAPVLGEHTYELLGELGYSKTEIDTMVASGALLAHTPEQPDEAAE
ncbi:MAG: CoA transferase [Rhodospirillaceae bacterium]|jgi:crotonobetainyl-CoA:carnitine CoA-transferase CaiB-like acyl-CoA transferase|nr:CoA transferase [Rhodospirillaceae bacterium]MBT4044238.1 CoA transferase [Rhodospirillaceae bacterium]MBT4688806.1 CoA transferase [Rhodospirillaceae bacterium]MBT5083368.1 CoA transferase [Rhodospirillaceae bacterium]MBT5525583.1 CoA transferase [Rhodospirillaceae bacterium]